MSEIRVFPIEGLEDVPPDRRGDEELALSTPIVHKHHGIHIGGGPELQLSKIKRLDERQKTPHVRRGIHDIHQGIRRSPQELVSLPWSGTAVGHYEFIRAAAEPVDRLSGAAEIPGKGFPRRLDIAPSADIRDLRLLDLAYHSVLDVDEPAPPLVRVGADFVWTALNLG